jgi:hypothetical protein
MFASLFIPSELSSIADWNNLQPILFIRTIFWLLGFFLFGFFVIKLFKCDNLSSITRIILAPHLSMVTLCLITLIYYSLRIGFYYLPPTILVLTTILFVVSSLKHFEDTKVSFRFDLSKLNITLLLGVIIAIIIGFAIQLSQQYLIPGDVWTSLQPSIQLISGKNVSTAFSSLEYPLMFGFVLLPISACLGLPIVNSYVALFPLISLNILCFYVLVRTVFNARKRVAVISSIFYFFSGGLGYLFNLLVFQGTVPFWSVSHLTYDMYFTVNFWNSIEFSYKTLALTFAFTSLILYSLSFKSVKSKNRALLAFLASLMMLFSFLIHMVEPLVLFPVILAITYFFGAMKEKAKNLSIFIIGVGAFFLLVDFLTSNYYSWLTVQKLSLVYLSIDIGKIAVYVALISAIGGLLLLFFKMRSKLFGTNLRKKMGLKVPHILKILVVSIVAILFISGLYFWATAPISDKPLNDSNRFPWFYNTTRYGFLGLLSLFGIGYIKWRDSPFGIAFIWGVFSLVLGTIWWGYRLSSYLFPIVAFLAAYGVINIWDKSSVKLHIQISTPNGKILRRFGGRLKPTITILLAVTIFLTFTSYMYGSFFYMMDGPSIDGNTASSFLWINHNTDSNSTLFVPDIYRIQKGIETISDRKTSSISYLPMDINPESFRNLTELLYTNGTNYLYTLKNSNTESPLLKTLLCYSEEVYESDNVSIVKLPNLTMPSSNRNDVVVIAEEPLGLLNYSNVGWADDSFLTGWEKTNTATYTDGAVLSYNWNFNSADEKEPSIKTYPPQISTNEFPYLTIRYRNTLNTSSTAENNLGQILTFVNSTGYPKGFFKNIFIPISKSNSFTSLTVKLPENQNVAQIWLWMRNYDKLNGTIGLQVDYIALSSSDFVQENPENVQFLSWALPSLWATNYSIVNDSNYARNANIIVTPFNDRSFIYVSSFENTNSFIFLKNSSTLPDWPVNWSEDKPGILEGTLNGKQIFLVLTNEVSLNNYENLISVSKYLEGKAKT